MNTVLSKKDKAIIAKIETNKELSKAIGKIKYYSTEKFLKDAKTYIAAIKQRRMINTIKSVSSTGMSRVIKFTSIEVTTRKNEFWYRQYSCLFISLGYPEVKGTDSFRISGCGMDMIFHTNYSIIHDFERLGIINRAECDKLCQMTPKSI